MTTKISFSGFVIKTSFLATLVLTALVALQDIQNSAAAWWLIMSIMVLPLLSFSHAVFTLKTRSLTWLCFVLCLYFTMATVDFMTNAYDLLYGLLALSTTLLFCSILVFIRQQSNIRKTAGNPLTSTC